MALPITALLVMLLRGFLLQWLGWLLEAEYLNQVAGSVLYLFQVQRVSGYWLYILIAVPVVIVILSLVSRYADLQLTFPTLASVVEVASLALIHQGTGALLMLYS